MQQTGTTVETTKMCTNLYCQTRCHNDEYIDYISTTVNEGRKRQDLQEILNSHFSENKFSKCSACRGKVMETLIIKKAPQILLLEVPKGKVGGVKIDTKINCPDGKVVIKANGEDILYRAKGVIIHNGNTAGNGHYIYNHYREEEDKWIVINDHKVFDDRDHKKYNEGGTLFILVKEPKYPTQLS